MHSAPLVTQIGPQCVQLQNNLMLSLPPRRSSRHHRSSNRCATYVRAQHHFRAGLSAEGGGMCFRAPRAARAVRAARAGAATAAAASHFGSHQSGTRVIICPLDKLLHLSVHASCICHSNRFPRGLLNMTCDGYRGQAGPQMCACHCSLLRIGLVRNRIIFTFIEKIRNFI